MKIVLWICTLLLSLPAIAANVLPKGCTPIAVQQDTVTIKNKKPRLVFIHNTTENDLWITHQVVDSGANAGWSSRLQANKWSALVVAKGPFAIECIESKPGHEQQIPCPGAIVMCQWKKSKMPKDHKGDYWAAEDMTLRALMAAIGDKGFKIPNNE